MQVFSRGGYMADETVSEMMRTWEEYENATGEKRVELGDSLLMSLIHQGKDLEERLAEIESQVSTK